MIQKIWDQFHACTTLCDGGAYLISMLFDFFLCIQYTIASTVMISAPTTVTETDVVVIAKSLLSACCCVEQDVIPSSFTPIGHLEST